MIMISILVLGTSGYMFIEGSNFLDSLYMTVITITTVGFGEVVPLTTAGKYFTILLITVGVGFVLFVFTNITEAMVEGGMRRMLGRKKMDKEVATLGNHYIVCGFGRIGKVICRILKENKRPFVVIENSHDEISKTEELGYLALLGEASNDDMLIKAGIERAKGLIAVVSSDAENVYIILSAKGLKPSLYILARSSGEEGSETKLLRAGASKVISPYNIGAHRMAHLLVKPTVIDFLDLTLDTGLGLRLEELTISEQSKFKSITLRESNIRSEFDLIIVAIKRGEGKMLFNPKSNATIQPGDTLVILGEHENIKSFEKLL